MSKGNFTNQPKPCLNRNGYTTREEFPPVVLNKEAFEVATFMFAGVRPELSELLLDSLVQKYRDNPKIYQEHRDFYNKNLHKGDKDE